MNTAQTSNMPALPGSEATPVLFHDGCNVCLDISHTLMRTIPGLAVIDLGLHPQFKSAALARGVEQLPSLVVGRKVLPIASHSDIEHIGE